MDAAEAVTVDATELPAVTDIEDAMQRRRADLTTSSAPTCTVHWVPGGGGDQGIFDSAPVIGQ